MLPVPPFYPRTKRGRLRAAEPVRGGHHMPELSHFANALLEAAPDAVIVTDGEGRVALVNVQAEVLLGFSREELRGRDMASLLQPLKDHAPWRDYAGPALVRRRAAGHSLELFALHREGASVPVEVNLAPVTVEGRPYTIAVLHDLTERRRLEDHLMYLSRHDSLTGLANRSAFDDALARLDESGPHPIGVVMLDLDDLKRINDERGHSAGDAMLRRVADVLRFTFRTGDVVARIGGDEFAVLTAGRDAAAIEVLAMRLQEAVALHNLQGEAASPLRVSLGVAVADTGMSVVAALKDADTRMYSMKRAHHGR